MEIAPRLSRTLSVSPSAAKLTPQNCTMPIPPTLEASFVALATDTTSPIAVSARRGREDEVLKPDGDGGDDRAAAEGGEGDGGAAGALHERRRRTAFRGIVARGVVAGARPRRTSR